MPQSTVIRVLLIEDQASDAELVARALQRGGTPVELKRVWARETLAEALKTFTPDVVLSDFTLPGFDGFEAMALVREHDAEMPFVFVSGTLGEEWAVDAVKRGATDYVLKSSLLRLPTAVRRALEESVARRARRAAETELRESERRLRDIVEASQDWIWELDAEGRFVFSNGAVQDILGRAPNTLIGVHHASLLHPEDQWRETGLLPDPSKSQYAIRGMRARWKHADGSARWLERSATAVMNGDVLAGFRGIDRDVTKQLEHEARIHRLDRVRVLLTSVNAAVARARDRGALLQEICRLAVERGGYARAIVALQDEPGADLRPVAWDSVLHATLDTLPLPLSRRAGPDERSLAAIALASGNPAVEDDVERSTDLPRRQRTGLRAAGVAALALLPLSGADRPLGVLSLESREPGIFDSEELTLLEQVAAEIAQALQHFERDETLHFLSWYDPLTQLARRELFCQRLSVLCGEDSDTPAAVVALDIDNIGIVNDTLGRETGDAALRAVAERLRVRMGNTDRLAHFGGGVFAIALSGADADGAGLTQARLRLREAFADPVMLDGQEIDLHVRMGAARHPTDAKDARTLVQNAETALRRAKATGLDDYDYTVTLNEQLARTMLIGQRLHRALSQSQFLLHYQPVVDLDTGRLVGAEALLRWHDPERGLVPPNEFIPQLESSGEIVEVGQWVLEQVVRDSALLSRAGAARLHIAVNISQVQLACEDFVDRVLQVAADAAHHQTQLTIEITESMLMQDLETSINKLSRVREAGVHVSIDDFGTGYSSLSMLARLPIDSLKIDRSFISPLARDPASMTVVSTIMSLARSFHLTAVGEGIEDAEQLELLKLMKCDYGQGYFFGRPQPLQNLIERFAEPALRVASTDR